MINHPERMFLNDDSQPGSIVIGGQAQMNAVVNGRLASLNIFVVSNIKEMVAWIILFA